MFIKLGYKHTFSDQCVYHWIRDGVLSIVAVHVDNMALFSHPPGLTAGMKKELSEFFTITDLGGMSRIVELEVKRDWVNGTMRLTQTQYVLKILSRFGMDQSKPVHMPMNLNVKLNKTPSDEKHDIPHYLSAVGSLTYVAIGMRPDNAFAVQLSQFNSNPGPEHWTAVKGSIGYLNSTQDYGITYQRSDHINDLLTAYADSNWGNNPDD